MGGKGTKTKEKIRQQARRLFAEKGFQAVTMSDICERTGLSRGGLYRYYSGTGQIFSEILVEEYAAANEMEGESSARTVLEHLLETLRTEIMDKERSLSLAIYEYASLGNETFFAEIHAGAKKRWMHLLEYGMKTGEFKPVDAGQMSELILYYYQGLRMWSRVIPFEKQTAGYYVSTIKQMLLEE